ncbi:MAG: PAS domain S-box protein [Ignavibacterium sp.]|nr:PAS domain S-box protein [Ignavibacterium sp.]
MEPSLENLSKVNFYVGVGASAGGLEALELLFSNMPNDTGMAFIVIQHLSPEYKSLMVEILSKKTEIPVQRAENGMLVEPNNIYIIPPKKNLSIFHGKLILSEYNPAKGLNLPIDHFFRSLAEDQGERSIGIILSGTGSDGVRGIREIKAAGGIVIVQSEESAKFNGMPKSAISTGLVDFILPPEEIPQKLISLNNYPQIRHKDTKQVLLSDEDGLMRIFALLREKMKIDFTFYKPSTILRRIEKRMTVNQITDLRDYVRLLENQTGELVILFKELLIGVTHFFRDKEVFDQLEQAYFDKIFLERNKREYRFWVVGCSTGEEAYSIAILTKEYLDKKGLFITVKIFATDVDKDAILKASNGVFGESIKVDVPVPLLNKYFHFKDDQYIIDRSIREMVVFAQHNIIKDPPFTNIDFISCRNLLIYFQPVLQKKVLEMFNFSLNQGGILLLGNSETVGDMIEYFEILDSKLKFYTSKGKKTTAGISMDITAEKSFKYNYYNKYLGASKFIRQYEEEKFLETVLNAVSNEYFELVVIVNQQFEILHIVGNTTLFFSIPSGKPTNDITKVIIKELSIPIATGVQKVFKTGEEIRYTNVKYESGNKSINLRLKSLPNRRGQEQYCIIFFENPKSIDNSSNVKSNTYDIIKETEQRINDLEQELQFTRENLQATIEELETSNEELQATNEELLASNEELQSTNEELQSVNEELHTVNAEYHSKIIELTEINNDFENLLNSSKINVIFLDENLDVRKYSQGIKKIFNISPKNIGLPFSSLAHNLIDINLNEIIQKVKTDNIERDIEVETIDNNWYLMKVLSYKIGNESYSGILISFVEINELKKYQTDLIKNQKKIQSLYKTLPVGIILEENDFIYEINEKFSQMFGYSREELLGKPISILFESNDQFSDIKKKINQQIQIHGLSSFEIDLVKKDKSKINCLVNVTYTNPENIFVGKTFSITDLTLRNIALSEAKEIQEKYKHLYDTMANGVIYQDSEGRIISANNAAIKILGLSSEKEIIGLKSSDFKTIYTDGSEFKSEDHPISIALKTGKPVYGVTMGVFNNKLNKYVWIYIDAIPLFKENQDKPYQVYATFSDITEKVESQIELEKLDKRLKHALEINNIGWWEYNVKTNTVFVGELKAKLIGFELFEVPNDLDFWLQRIHPDDYEMAMQSMRDCLEGKKQHYEVIYRLKTKDNKWKKFYDVGKITEFDELGNPIILIGTIKELNE